MASSSISTMDYTALVAIRRELIEQIQYVQAKSNYHEHLLNFFIEINFQNNL